MTANDTTWVVLKFGGTSVAQAQNWENIRSIIQERRTQGKRVCLVHSALGGVSDKLQALIDQAPFEEVNDIVSSIKQQHLELGQQLDVGTQDLLEDDFKTLDQIVRDIQHQRKADYYLQAQLLSLGELMATKLGAAYLQQHLEDVAWADARKYIKSVPQKNARERTLMLSAISTQDYDSVASEALTAAGHVIVTQGFIGSNEDDETVLLGRGGSDVSAAYFAAKIGAKKLEIWTDVPGMFSANPHAVPSARLLNHLNYEEAQELATNGAEVLHPRSIMPAQKHGIPIYIKCTARPELEGTVISGETYDDEAQVKAISVRGNVTLISMQSLGMWQQVGFLSEVFTIFSNYGLSIDLVSTSQSSVTVSLDPGLNAHFNDVRDEVTAALGMHCDVEIISQVSAVSLLGRHIRTILHQLGSAFEVFEEHNVYLVSQASNDLNFTFVVESEQADRLVRQLHEQVISHSESQESFGPTWPELMEEEQTKKKRTTSWWQNKEDTLLEIAEKQSPAYVYDKATLRQNGNAIKALDAIDQPFYAIKANSHPRVMEIFRELGFGMECVSIGEVESVMELFPDISPTEILFTPNFAPREEYEMALDLGVNLTLDNSYPLHEWGPLFEGQEVFLRIDPGHGHGHHEHVKTGGVHSKFGIPQFEIPEVVELIKQHDVTVKGLHAHIGSGIKDPLLWENTAQKLHEVAEKLGGVDVLDLGGGFGIRENDAQIALNLDEVNSSLNGFKEQHPDYTLWVEPGRFLVATAGVLLTKVTQLKGKGAVRYVGVDTGMNSFIRPALYGARHKIVNLSKLDQPNTQTVNVVGPICESGDKLGIDRLFPESEEGDVVLLANAGAYGKVMSSDYNMRPPAEELVI